MCRTDEVVLSTEEITVNDNDDDNDDVNETVTRMKKKVLLLSLLLALTCTTFAQVAAPLRMFMHANKYWDVGYNRSTLIQDGLPDLKSSISVSFDKGKIFPLIGGHSKLQIGWDLALIGLQYSQYRMDGMTYGMPEDYRIHQARIAPHTGLSLMLNPVAFISIGVYAHYAPTLDAFLADRKVRCGFAHTFAGGAKVVLGFIGVGLEYRQSNATMSSILPVYHDASGRVSTITKDFRAYVTLNF